jgi:hypothetical protein
MTSYLRRCGRLMPTAVEPQRICKEFIYRNRLFSGRILDAKRHPSPMTVAIGCREFLDCFRNMSRSDLLSFAIVR